MTAPKMFKSNSTSEDSLPLYQGNLQVYSHYFHLPTRSIKTKFDVEHPLVGVMNVCLKYLDHMTKIAAWLIYGTISSSPKQPSQTICGASMNQGNEIMNVNFVSGIWDT